MVRKTIRLRVQSPSGTFEGLCSFYVWKYYIYVVFKALYTTLLVMLFYIPGICQTLLPAVIEKDTVLTMEGSPYYIQENLSINTGITLIINKGTQFIISNEVGISNSGNLIIEGSEAEMVLFTSDSPESRWNYISNQGTFIARHLMVRRAVLFVSSYGDTVIIENCDVADTYRGGGDDCIGVHDAQKVIIRNNSLTGNPDVDKTDAIDLDGISGDTISENIISGYSDDGIDIGTYSTNIVVSENQISNCDMGISIGEYSTVLVYKNLCINSNAGIQSHTGAVVDAWLNTLYGNIYGIRAFHYDGEESSGGTISLSSSIISGSMQGDLIGVGNSQAFFDYCMTDQDLLPGTGNITGNPLFMDAVNGDFNLSSSSAAIDAGNPDLDNDGSDYLVDEDDRDPDGSRVDMGCYPHYQSSLSVDKDYQRTADRVITYPNPVGSVLFMEFSEETGTRVQVRILNMSGILIDCFEFQAGGGSELISWQHRIKVPGAYMVRIVIQKLNHWRHEDHLLVFSGKQ